MDAGAAIAVTDEYPAYRALARLSPHYAVNHSRAYVSGAAHTNTIEGFWAHVKRAWYGQHHHFSRRYANRYVAELAWKYNRRRREPRAVFADLVRGMLCGTPA